METAIFIIVFPLSKITYHQMIFTVPKWHYSIYSLTCFRLPLVRDKGVLVVPLSDVNDQLNAVDKLLSHCYHVVINIRANSRI